MDVKRIEFFFDVGSPATYLAYTQLPALARQCGAAIEWRPMLLGGVFKATGNASPIAVPAKGRWMIGDLQRWASRYQVPFQLNPYFPINTLTLMRGALGYQVHQVEAFPIYLDAVFRAMWVSCRNLGDPDELAATLAGAGLDAAAFLTMVGATEVKAGLAAITEEAVARGVFGAPTFFVKEQMFFGQDRLDFVREALAGT